MVVSLAASEATRKLREEGVALVDIRTAPDYARGHPQGALSVPYSQAGLAVRVRTADPDAVSLVLVTTDEAQAERAERQLAKGAWLVHGHGPADPEWWRGAGRGWETLPERPVADLDDAADIVVVDVREPMEWDTGHVPGAILLPLGRLRDGLERIPPDREVVVICEAGVRSATGASILLKEGFRMVSHAPAGTAGIRQRGGRIAYPDTKREAQS